MDEKEKLYNALVERNLYSKSFEEFDEQFSSPEKIGKLHSSLKEQNLVSIPADSFQTKYFGANIENSSSESNQTAEVETDDTRPSISSESPQNGNMEASEDSGDVGRIAADFNSFMQGLGSFFTNTLPSSAKVGELASEVGRLPARAAFKMLGLDTTPLDKDIVDDEKVVGLANNLESDLREFFPENPEVQGKLEQMFFQGAGNLVGQIAAGSGLGMGSATALTTLSFSGDEFQNALNQTGDENKALGAMVANAPLGAAEMFPVGKLFGRLNKATGGSVSKTLRAGFVGGGEELIQEVTQQTVSNFAASKIYDETRELFDDVAEGGGVGFALGFLANAIGVSLKNRLSNPDMSKQERAQTERAIELTDQKAEEINEHSFSESTDQETQTESPNDKEQSTPKTITLSPINSDPNSEQAFDRPGPVRRHMEKWWLDKGNMPRAAYERKLKRDAKVAKQTQRLKFLVNDFNKAVNQAYDLKRRTKSLLSGEGFQKQTLSDEQTQLMNDVLRGKEDVDALPEQVRGPLENMRDHIDNMSRRIMDSGLAEGDLQAVIDNNIGSYLTRSYKIHDDPKWAKKIPDDIKNRAISYVRRQYKSEKGMNLTEDQALTVLNDLLFDQNEDAPMAILSGSKAGSKDYSILRKRKDIAPEIRAFMGEHTDPVVNYARSITKMANLIENQRFLEDVKQIGLDQGFFYEPDNLDRPEGFNSEIASKNSDVMSPLNGLRTTPEIKQAFTDAFTDANHGKFMEWALKINGVVKFSKTVGSVTTHVRNVMGGFGFAITNGHLPRYSHVKDAMQNVVSSFGGSFKDARSRVERLQELGLLTESASVGEIRGYLKDANIVNAESINDWMTGIEKGKGVFDKAVNTGRRLTEVYQGGDNFMRLIMFESEVQRYKRALPDATTREVEEIAASIVNKTYQNYSRLPKAIRELRKIPIVGTFASFPAEVMRSTAETVRQAKSELQSDNTEIKKIGMRRTAGVMATMGLTAAAQQATMAMLNMSDDEDRDARRFMAPWNKLSALAYVDKGRDGNFKFLNLSYTDPHEYIKDPIFNMINGEGNIEKRFAESMGEFLEPFLGEEILFEKVADINRNKQSNGAPVYNPEDPDRWADITAHLWKAFEPGTVSNLKRIGYAYSGIESESGKKYNVPDEVMGLFGMRVTEVNPKQSLKFKSFNYSKDIQNTRRIFTSVLNREGTVDPRELEGSYKKANAAWEGVWKEMRRDYEAAVRLGIDSREVAKTMYDYGLPKWVVRSVVKGSFVPFERDGKNDGR